MSKNDPLTRLDDESIGCSRCRVPLTKVLSPYYIRKEYVGHFNSLDCPLCHFHVFTEKGYGDAIQMAHRYGLVGPPEEDETCDTTQDMNTRRMTLNFVTEDIVIVQEQVSSVQLTESNNYCKIPRSTDENIDGLDELPTVHKIIVPIQSSLNKARKQLMV